MFGWLAFFRSGDKPGFGPAAELLFFASPKKSNQKKGEPRPCRLRGPLRYSQRSGHLQTRFAQTVQVPSSERCSVAQHVLMAVLNTPRLVRFANFAPVARSLRSPRGGWVTSFLFPHSSLLRPHSSLHPVIPGLTRNLPSSDCPYFAPCTSWRMGVPCHCACADAVRSRSIQCLGAGGVGFSG